MAKIIPFGDPNAHGSLADSVCFRRVRGGVVFQKKPNPRPSSTPAQLIQRASFTTSQGLWYGYDNGAKPFFGYRATMLGLTPRQLFCRSYLLNQLPVYQQFNCDQILTGYLHNPTGRTFANTQLAFYGWTSGLVLLGQFNCDTGLFFNNLSQGVNCVFQSVNVLTTVPWGNYEGFSFNYLDQLGATVTKTIRFKPGITDPTYGDDFWLCADETFYIDNGYTSWVTTNKI